MSTVDALIMDYREKREKYLGTLKKVAIYGVIRGALKYLDLLLECTSPDVVQLELGEDVEYNQEETHFDTLQYYIKHIFNQITQQFESSNLTVKPRNFPESPVM